MPFQETNNREFRQQVIVGHLIRQTRKEQGISIIQLADYIGKSKQYISEIEKGSKQLSFSVLNDVFGKLEIDFDFNEGIEFEAENCFRKLVIDYCYYRMNDFEADLRVLAEDKYYYAYSYPLSILSRYILRVIKSTESVTNQDDLDTSYLLQGDAYIFYQLFQSKERETLGDFLNAQQILSIAMKKMSSLSCLNAILYYNYAIISDIENNLLEAYEYNRKAKNMFDLDNNYIRSLFSEAQLAIIYSKLYKFDLAEKQYQKVISLAKSMNNQRIYEDSLCNLAMNGFYQADYPSCIRYSDDAITQGITYPYLWLYKAWSYYKLEDVVACKENLKILKQYIDSDPYLKLMYEIMISELAKNEQETERLLLSLKEYAITRKQATERLFALTLLIDHYAQRKMYQKAYHYQSQMIKLYQSNC